MAKRFPEVNPEDAQDKHLALFLISEFHRGISGSTLKATSTAINWRAAKALKRGKVSGPLSQEALHVLRREAALRGRGAAQSLDMDQIRHLIETTVEAGNAWSLRDAGVISTTFYGTLRIGEALALDQNHVKFLPSGEAELYIPRSKTDQNGKGTTVLIPESRSHLSPRLDRIRRDRLGSSVPVDPVFRIRRNPSCRPSGEAVLLSGESYVEGTRQTRRTRTGPQLTA